MNEPKEPQVSAPQVSKGRTQRLSAEKALPQSGSDTLVKIIKGYVVASNGGEKPVKYTDVGSVIGVTPNTVSGNNAFLAESEFLRMPKYGYYLPGEEAVRFAREAAWDEQKAKAQLRKVIGRTWYGQAALQIFSLRNSLTKDDLKRSLAIKCGATEGDSLALDRLVDFIVYSGIVAQNDQGLLVRGNLEEVQEPIQAAEESAGPGEAPSTAQIRPRLRIRPAETDAGSRRTTSIVLHIHINNLDELSEEKAEKLLKWLELLNSKAAVELPDEVAVDVDYSRAHGVSASAVAEPLSDPATSG